MRIVFVGSGDLACPALRSLVDRGEDDVVGVIAQPDRPAGRQRRILPCPLKAMADEIGLNVMTPEKINSKDSLTSVEELKPDLIVVAAYGQFLSEKLIDLAPLGAINIHPSLLPKYRGAAPIQWALINGEEATGVTILFVTKEMDAGAIIRQKEVPVEPEDTAYTLAPRLAEEGAKLLLAAIDDFRNDCVQRIPQDDTQVVFAPKFKKEDGRITFERPAPEIANRIRGMNPWPGCFCEPQSGKRLRLLFARVEQGTGLPGEILDCNADGPLVACGEGAVRLTEVQPAGKRPMQGGDYCNGHQIKAGSRLA